TKERGAWREAPMPNVPAARPGAGRPPACRGPRIEVMIMSQEFVRTPGVESSLSSQWAQVRGRLRTEFGEATFRSWLKPLTLIGQIDSQISIAVKTRFMRDCISHHYAARMLSLRQARLP